MGPSTLFILWTFRCVVWISLGGMIVSTRYQYPAEPYIDFSVEIDQTCPNGCSICTDVRYICTSLNVSTVPQTFPATIQYLKLTDIPTLLDIGNNTFKRYSDLRYLDISRNRIKSVPDEALRGLKKLEYLKISQSGIIVYNYYNRHPRSLIDLGHNALVDLAALKYLDLRGNNRLGLTRTMERLENLTKACPNCTTDYLDLSYTNDVDVRKSQIQSYTLKTLKLRVINELKVKALKLDGNHISSVDFGFGPMLSSLEYLSLKENYLSAIFWYHGNMFITADLFWLYNLKVLDMGNNAHLPIKEHVPVHVTSRNCIVLPLHLEEVYWDDLVLHRDFLFFDNNACVAYPNNLKVLDIPNSIIGGFGRLMTGLYNATYVNLQNARITFTDPDAFNCENIPELQTLLLGNVDFQPLYSKLNETISTFHNCSKMTSIDLENTNYPRPQVHTFTEMENVQYINLSNNGIVSLDIDLSNNMALILLNISSNRITHLSVTMMSHLDSIAMAKKKQSKLVVDLSSNPLLCGCSQLSFVKWMKTTKVQFHNYETYRCLRDSEYELLHDLRIDETILMCQMTIIVSVSTSVGVMLVLSIVILFVYAKRHRLEYFYLLSRQMVRRILQKQADDNRVFCYHGFLSYSSNDDLSIIVNILEKMEKEFGLSLVIHHRDFIPGEFITANIFHFIDASRKVIILLSNNYLESKWCKFEFELSQNKRLDATYDTMVMILLHDIKDLNKDKISSSLKNYLGQKTYLQWPKDSSQTPAFWLRLKEALDFGNVQNDTTEENTQVTIVPHLNHEGERILNTEVEVIEVDNGETKLLP